MAKLGAGVKRFYQNRNIRDILAQFDKPNLNHTMWRINTSRWSEKTINYYRSPIANLLTDIAYNFCLKDADHS